MGLFEDFSRFLETRLEEFLRNNPHLELQALDEQLREQEADTLRLIGDLQRQEKNTEASILNTAQEVQRWHIRIEKAKKAQRWDLVKPAEEREAALLREGNQLWGQMTGIKDRIQQTKELYQRIQTRRKEVKAKLQEAAEAARAAQAAQASSWSTNWNPSADYGTSSSRSTAQAADPLEAQFRRWEMEDELNEMKRNMGR